MSMPYSYTAIGLTIVILVLAFIILINGTRYWQIFTFSNTHTSSITPTPHPLSVLQQQQMNQPNLHLVKIISPLGVNRRRRTNAHTYTYITGSLLLVVIRCGQYLNLTRTIYWLITRSMKEKPMYCNIHNA